MNERIDLEYMEKKNFVFLLFPPFLLDSRLEVFSFNALSNMENHTVKKTLKIFYFFFSRKWNGDSFESSKTRVDKLRTEKSKKRKLKLSRRSKNFWPNFRFSSTIWVHKTKTSGLCHEARVVFLHIYLLSQVASELQTVHEPSATTTVGLSGFHSLKFESDNWSWIRLLFSQQKKQCFFVKIEKCKYEIWLL